MVRLHAAVQIQKLPAGSQPLLPSAVGPVIRAIVGALRVVSRAEVGSFVVGPARREPAAAVAGRPIRRFRLFVHCPW